MIRKIFHIVGICWILCLSYGVFAADAALILVGGGTPADNYSIFADDVKKAYQATEKMGLSTTVMYADGKLDGVENVQPAISPDKVETAIKAKMRALADQGGGNLLLYIGDHGIPPASEKDVMSGGPVLYAAAKDKPYYFQHHDLQKLFEKTPANVKVKLVGDYCYSGGMHEIAFSNPNICSLSATDWRTVGTSFKDLNRELITEKLGEKDFTTLFWRQASEHKSLQEAGDFAIRGSALEEGQRGQLSSMAFVDKVLGAGAYDPNNTASWIWDFRKRWTRPTPFLPTSGSYYDDDIDCRESANDFGKINQLAGQLGDVFAKLENDPTKAINADTLSTIPSPLQNRYRKAIADWQANGEKYKQKLSEVLKEYDRMMADYNKRSTIMQYVHINEFIHIDDKYEIYAKKELKSYIETKAALEEAPKIEKFMKQATDEQKKTFLRLLQCESEPL